MKGEFIMGKLAERKKKMDELAKLFNANEGTKTACACRGKWSGTTDYSVTFDNNERYFISNGMSRFDEVLDYTINKYNTFLANKQNIITSLKKIEARDKQKAEELGLLSYELIDVDYIKNGGYLGWFFVTIKVADKIRTFMETGLNAAIKDSKYMEKYVNNVRDYFVAGGVKKAEFVFNNVGFSMNSHTTR